MNKQTSFAIVLLLLLSFKSIAQNIFSFQRPVKMVSIDKANKLVPLGEEISIDSIGYGSVNGFTVMGFVGTTKNSSPVFILNNALHKYELKQGANVIDIWQNALVEHGILTGRLQLGFQYDLRNDMHQDAVDFTNAFQSSDMFFNDAYLEDYLYELINKIHGGLSNFGKPGSLSIRILKDIEPNAYMLSNGMMLISTGLLSTIQSEDELVGILAHEIAHYVLDHQITNYNKSLDRQKRADFWAGFATIVAASADVYLTSKNDKHIPGLLTASTYLAATVLTESITTQLGIKYSKSQEEQADIAAAKILAVLKYDSRGLALALSRMKTHFINTGNFLALTGSGTHPTIESRIAAVGLPSNIDTFTQSKYLKRVSHVNTYNARLALWNHNHPFTALELANRNLRNGVGTEEDYIVASIVKRRYANSSEDINDALKLLQTAKNLDIEGFLMVYKEEGITHLRLNNKIEAKKAFQLYLSVLLEFKARNGLNETNNKSAFIQEEIEWAKKMIYKVDRLD